MRALHVAALAASLTACGARLTAPPPIFPLKTAWSAALDGLLQSELVSDGQAVYVGTKDGRVRAVDPEKGSTLWEVTQPGRLLAGDGFVIVRGEDGSVTRLETTSGQARWRTKTEVAGTLPAARAGETVMIVGTGAAALDLASGRVLWTADDAEASAPPTASGNTLLVGEKDGTLRARAVASGQTLWTFATGGELFAPAIVDRDRVFVGTSRRAFYAVSLDKGQKLWRWKLGADVHHAAAILGDSVIFGTHESILYALSRRNGNMVWRVALPSRPQSAPLILGSAVLVACLETDLAGFDGRTGRKLGGLKVPATFATGPLVLGTRLFVGLRDKGTLAAVDFSTGRPEPSPSPSIAPSGQPTASPGAASDPAAPPPATPSGVVSSPSPAPSPTPTPTPTPRPAVKKTSILDAAPAASLHS